MLFRPNALKCLILFIKIAWIFSSEIERVDDNDLLHLLTGEDYVVVLFTKTDCPTCVEYENVLSIIEADLKQTLGAVVAKAHDSNLVGIYDPTREPAIVYFRRGIPLLYNGEVHPDDIVYFFTDNKEPVVKELSDQNFEHLTQASTGATTGDWFIFFYSAECVFCQRLYAVWESVGATLRRKLNVARINRVDAGYSTAKRLTVLESPEFIFLRHGKIYRYKEKEYTPKAFIEFVENGYLKQKHPEKVPPPSNFIDKIMAYLIQDYINGLILYSLGIIIMASLCAAYVVKRLLKKRSRKVATKKDT